VAEISLDGVVIGRGTAEVVRPRDGHRYQLRISAPDRAAITEVLAADSDVRVDRVLALLTAPPAPQVPPPLPTHPNTTPRRPSPPPPGPSHPGGDQRQRRFDPNNPF